MGLKICILTCYTGEGHNSAARALQEEFLARGAEAELMDPVGQRSHRAQGFVSGFYNGIIRRAPRAFGALYRAGAVWEKTGVTSPVYYANASCARAVAERLRAGRYTGVVCTHLYGMEAMTAARRRGLCDLPAWGVFTDYTSSPFLAETDLDGYFAPHPDVIADFAAKGGRAERVEATGIPVSLRFARETPRDEARALLGLPRDKRLVLIMTGGVGCENMLRLCSLFLEQRDADTQACVLAGHNEKLLRLVEEWDAGRGVVRAVPFTREVPLYMRAADSLLSKPGGLSSTEAAVANVPFVCVNPIPGCETENARFFSQRGMAVSARTDGEAVAAALSLARDEAAASRMRAAQRAYISPYAARDIVEKVLGA